MPPGKAFVVMLAVPPLSKNVGAVDDEVEFVNDPIVTGEGAVGGVAIKTTLPVGVPDPVLGVTPTWKVTVVPCAIVPEGEVVIFVVDGIKLTVLQPFARLVTFTEPKPVALS